MKRARECDDILVRMMGENETDTFYNMQESMNKKKVRNFQTSPVVLKSV